MSGTGLAGEEDPNSLMWGKALPFREWVPWQTRQEAVSKRWAILLGDQGFESLPPLASQLRTSASIAAVPLTNLVSPTGFILTGPSARYIEPHSIKTVWVMLGPGMLRGKQDERVSPDA